MYSCIPINEQEKQFKILSKVLWKKKLCYYSWRPQIILKKNEVLKIVDKKIKAIDWNYAEIYNDNGKTFSASAFLNKKSLTNMLQNIYRTYQKWNKIIMNGMREPFYHKK